jgi:uncharacterized protein GlcG (DUF336 family)
MDTVPARKLSKNGALKILNVALARAEELKCAVSVAVVDDGAHLMAFGRSDKAELYSVAIAQAKARSAALTRFPSGKKSPSGNDRDDHHAIAITLAAGAGSFVTIPGGFPLMAGGECVGAVAVSGAGHNDVEIAKLAAAALTV